MERGIKSFDTESKVDFVASAKAVKGRNLSYEYAKLRNVKVDLQEQLDNFDNSKLRPKDRILEKRKLKNDIPCVGKELELSQKEMDQIYG